MLPITCFNNWMKQTFKCIPKTVIICSGSEFIFKKNKSVEYKFPKRLLI